MFRALVVSCCAIISGLLINGAPAAERGPAPKSPPGGSWSDRSHQGGASSAQHQYPQGFSAASRPSGANERSPSAAEGAAAENPRSPQPTGKQDAAAGAAAENRRTPQPSAGEGAAAGAAAENRRNPQPTAGEGAAAGAAVANRNQPQFSGAQGAAAGAAVANRNDPALSGAQGAALGAASVRNSFDNHGLYGQAWYAANPNVWAPAQVANGAAWNAANWSTVAPYVGAANNQTWYDFGVNVTCQDGNVSINGQPAGTAEQFSQQAADIAQTGADAKPADSDQWLPLGVFAMVRNEQQHPTLIFQLAVNKQGVIRGNYTDEVTEHTQPIQGAVDPKTQRACWTVGANKAATIDVGLSNLTDGEAPALIHKSGSTDHWLLVRLDQPAAKPAAGGGDK